MINAGERVKVRPVLTGEWDPIVGEVVEDDEVALRVYGNGRYDHVIPWARISRVEVTRKQA